MKSSSKAKKISTLPKKGDSSTANRKADTELRDLEMVLLEIEAEASSPSDAEEDSDH